MSQRAIDYATRLATMNAAGEDNDLTHLAREFLKLTGAPKVTPARAAAGWGEPFGAGPPTAAPHRGW